MEKRMVRYNEIFFHLKYVSSLIIALMMDEPVRIKDATTALEPPSRIVYIRGLTRPFTLPLLKELLSRYGTLVDGEFWLDKIKSQCFVTVNILIFCHPLPFNTYLFLSY
jgi:hypothetical protein